MDLGFRVYSLGSCVQGVRVLNLGFGIQGLKICIWGSGERCRVGELQS